MTSGVPLPQGGNNLNGDEVRGSGQQPQPKQAAEVTFFQALIGDGLPLDLHMHVFALAGRRTTWVRTVDEAVAAVAATNGRNIYAGVGIGAKGGPGERIKIATALGTLGVGADIDIADPVHKVHTKLPATEQEAFALLDALGLNPTLIIHSGHGVQAWWLYSTPFLFNDDTRDQAVQLGEDWQAYINQIAEQKFGWHFDSVGDIARILRVPGTWNAKDVSKQVPVRLRRYDPTARYTPKDLATLCDGYAARRPTAAQAYASVMESRRHTKAHPCVICHGYREMKQGNGERCWGYDSQDGLVCFCTREEYAGALEPYKIAIGDVYLHHLRGYCGCGQVHGRLGAEGKSLEVRGVGTMAQPARIQILTDEQAEDLEPVTGILGDVIYDDSVIPVYAPPGRYKTFLVTSWAACIGAGIEWFGRKTQQGAVVIISYEGARGVGKRLKAAKRHLGINESIPVFVVPTPVHMLDAAHVEELIRVIRTVLPDGVPLRLIVIDTLTRAMVGGDENNAQDIGLLMDTANRLHEEFRCCVMPIHHTGYDTSHGRGSTALSGNADGVIRLEAPEHKAFNDKLHPGDVVKIISEKPHRDGEEFADIAFKTEVVSWEDARVPTGRASTLVVVPAEPVSATATAVVKLHEQSAKLLRLLRRSRRAFPNGLTYSEWLELARDENGTAKRTFDRYLAQLRESRRVVYDEAEKRYCESDDIDLGAM